MPAQNPAAKPAFLSPSHAARFKDTCVAELYQFRPPYSAELYTILKGLLPATQPRILDAGCGPGKIARQLAPAVERVDAIDFSAEMIRCGQAMPGGAHPNIHWQCSPIETADLLPTYGLIVTGASLHWMDWDTVLPRFAQHLDPNGHLAIVNGDGPWQPAWQAERRAAIAAYSTNQDYQPFDLVEALVARKRFEPLGQRQTEPIKLTQTVKDFLKSEHSRESLSLEAMGPEQAAAFDDRVQTFLAPFTSDGQITYNVRTSITWGKPR